MYESASNMPALATSPTSAHLRYVMPVDMCPTNSGVQSLSAVAPVLVFTPQLKVVQIPGTLAIVLAMLLWRSKSRRMGACSRAMLAPSGTYR